MTALLWLLASGAAGAVLGAVYFGHLRAMTRRLASARQPVQLMLFGMAARFAMALGLFYLLARYGGWAHALAGVAGFTAVRLVTVHRAAMPDRSDARP